mgnify:CR=1 FL=1
MFLKFGPLYAFDRLGQLLISKFAEMIKLSEQTLLRLRTNEKAKICLSEKAWP